MLRHNRENRAHMLRKNTTSLFIASAVFVAACLAYVYIFLISTRDEVRNLNAWVDHSKIVIAQVYVTMTLQEAMLAEQRGYLLTGDEKSLGNFERTQNNLKIATQRLVELTNDHPEQNRAADEIRDFSSQYIAYVNKRKDSFKDMYREYNQCLDR